MSCNPCAQKLLGSSNSPVLHETHLTMPPPSYSLQGQAVTQATKVHGHLLCAFPIGCPCVSLLAAAVGHHLSPAAATAPFSLPMRKSFLNGQLFYQFVLSTQPSFFATRGLSSCIMKNKFGRRLQGCSMTASSCMARIMSSCMWRS
eukprot:707963-Amphidinium_carterae.1